MTRGLLGLALWLSGCATTGSQTLPGEGAGVGSHLPDVTVHDFDGHDLAPQSLRGKVVLVDVWASWCAPCKEELPLLDSMATRLRDKGVTILAVSIDEDREQALGFLKAQRASWSLALAHDPEGRLAGKLKPAKMPTSYIVDRAGVIRGVNEGFERSDVAKIEARLEALAQD